MTCCGVNFPIGEFTLNHSAPEPEAAAEPEWKTSTDGRPTPLPAAVTEARIPEWLRDATPEGAPAPNVAEPAVDARAERTKPVKSRKTRAPRNVDSDTAADWPMRVPVPGGRLRGGRGSTLAFRYTVLVAGSLVSAGVLAVTAYGIGRASAPNVADEVDQTVAQYGLTTYDTTSAETYAADYLRTCLRRYSQTSERPAPQEEARAAAVKAHTAVGDDPACTASPSSKARSVTSTQPVGKPTPVPGLDRASYVTIQTETTDGTTARYVVPVFFDDPATGRGPRVVGNVGVMPVPGPGTPNTESFPSPVTDTALAREWEKSLLPQVMTAWVASKSLDQFLTADATPNAQTGLHGQFTNVKVTKVTATPPPEAIEDADTGEFRYTDDVEVPATVATTMRTKDGAASGATYRVTLRKQGDHWFVVDVQGGAIGNG